MGVTYRLEDGLLRIDAEGTYTPEAFFEAAEAGLTAWGSQGMLRLLCDVSRSRSLVERSMDDVRTAADYYAGLLDRLEGLAILAERRVDYGLMRMLASMAEARGCRVEVFRDEDEARQWLTGPGLPVRPPRSQAGP